ncbi:HTH-type transcriptional regulator IscR [wastewater metagenome]|uniref:HTH-type transcriptional regulator IscR n=2 Tax=unclassified sequences TaxID=12908 RepID=A0A5B8R6G1_9ZZZZ|nr:MULTISPECIES: Rrf2 family transcriptional regulator [Arhodomonas]MCS4504386.1 Rrf2 family transcriptional regulator [Arhodomonas aquaeolei]QEA04579.1 HTH-type transcriptional regulator IscR [uncultured organism]
MRLTSKARYAVTAMTVLALREPGGRTSLAELGAEQGISLSYLEQLFAALRRARLVTGVRGPGGGYRLARPASGISVAAVVSAVDPAGGDGAADDDAAAQCLTHDLWSELSGQLYTLLDGITLETLAADPAIIAALEEDVRESAGPGG